MDLKELKRQSESQLQKTLVEQREKLVSLRFKIANNQLKKMREIRQVRKTIARILTLLNNK